MGYPHPSEEIEVLNRLEKSSPIDELYPVISLEELINLQQQVKEIKVDQTMKGYIVELANKTREDTYIYLGVSPRGSIALMRASQAYAMLQGRDYVTPDDIQYLAPFVFGHRVILRPEARYDGVSTEEVLLRIIKRAPVPIKGKVNQ